MMKNRKEIIKIAFIALSVIIFVGKLLPYNYPSDIYNVFVMGYKNYANTWFLTSGRLVGLLVFHIFDFFNISVNIGIFILKTLSILIAIYSIYTFYELVINSLDDCNELKNYGFLCAILITFLNFSTYEWFYYTESAVMWLSLLFVVLALKVYFFDSKYKKIKILFLLFLSLNCYQATVLFYIPSLFTILSIRKNKFKYILKEVIINSFIVCINIIIDYLLIILLRNLTQFIPFRSIDLNINYKKILYLILNVLFYFYDNFPNILIFCVNYLCLIYVLLKDKFDYKNALVIFFIYFISLAELIIMVGIIDFYLAVRIEFVYIATTGLIFTYLFSKSSNSINTIFYLLFCLIILGVFYINSYDLTKNSKIARENDDIYGKAISKMILNYEKENNITVNEIEYCYDSKPTRCYNELRWTLEATCRALYGNWILENVFNYYCNNHNITVNLNGEIYKSIFNTKNWDNFSEEQIVFENNKMYFCIY